MSDYGTEQGPEGEIIRYFSDDNIGLTPGADVTLEERVQPDGKTKYWRASQPIGTIFGSPVDGICEGYGSTKEKALEALTRKWRELGESLWF